MADVLSKERRSYCMSRIRSAGNRETELRMIALFREHGITGWRRKWPLFGRPDFVFPRQRVAVFVDGCFWHGCPRHYTEPANNKGFWRRKLQANRARDRLVNRVLRKKGWHVLRIWEHDAARKSMFCVRRIRRALNLQVNK